VKSFLNTLIAWGPVGLFLFAVVDGAGVPTPGGLDWLLLLLTIHTPSGAWGFAGLALAGSMIGCMFMFFVARKGGEAVLRKYRSRPRFERLEKWFQRYGLLTVFIPALVPIPMPLKFFILCAGVFKVTPIAFFFTLLAARIPRYLGLAYLGARLGSESFPWLKAHVWHMLGIAAALFLFLYLLIKLADRRRKLHS
jgi:membrane protein DedA with SNARE-associated domain